jgi:carbonic anhydrase/acetyltransferase-like protein (isoleucine patch superfamily)
VSTFTISGAELVLFAVLVGFVALVLVLAVVEAFVVVAAPAVVPAPALVLAPVVVLDDPQPVASTSAQHAMTAEMPVLILNAILSRQVRAGGPSHTPPLLVTGRP